MLFLRHVDNGLVCVCVSVQLRMAAKLIERRVCGGSGGEGREDQVTQADNQRQGVSSAGRHEAAEVDVFQGRTLSKDELYERVLNGR